MRKQLIVALSVALFGVAPLAAATPFAFTGTYQPHGTLTLIERLRTRSDLTLSEDGKTRYVLNQHSDNLTRFYIDSSSGMLRFSDDYTAIGAPFQMVIVP
ncbi:beta-propeller fold lactonase family protein [Pantoea sp. FN0302]|uniref:beta-propeller fold lactonase family protein n=1 Tax=unclassified Pantoea TaxID=2630326 RepID=UPI003CF42CDF